MQGGDTKCALSILLDNILPTKLIHMNHKMKLLSITRRKSRQSVNGESRETWGPYKIDYFKSSVFTIFFKNFDLSLLGIFFFNIFELTNFT